MEERIFGKVFEIAEISKFNKIDMNTYEQSLKEYRDYRNTVITAREEGVLQGHKETALMMIKEGCDNEFIAKVTHLSEEKIEKLRQQ